MTLDYETQRSAYLGNLDRALYFARMAVETFAHTPTATMSDTEKQEHHVWTEVAEDLVDGLRDRVQVVAMELCALETQR